MMVAELFWMNHAHTRSGCSDRRYQVAVIIEKSGMLAAWRLVRALGQALTYLEETKEESTGGDASETITGSHAC